MGYRHRLSAVLVALAVCVAAPATAAARARVSGRSVGEGEGGALAPQRRPRLCSTSRDTVAAARAWWYSGRRRLLRRPQFTYGRSCRCIGKVS
jgi:hypothetical protein